LVFCSIAFAPNDFHFSPPPEASCEIVDLTSQQAKSGEQPSSIPNQALQDTAQQLMVDAAIAYCNLDIIKEWQCPRCASGFQVQGVYQIPETSAFVIMSHDTIIVSFRGTSGSIAWLSNLKFGATIWPKKDDDDDDAPEPGGECDHCAHQGFGQIFIDVMRYGLRKTLYDLLEEHSDAAVFITGHSLGGALATLLAYDVITSGKLSDAQLRKFSVFTFGSPRVFTKSLAGEYNYKIQNSYRFVHNKDPVPHVPFQLPNSPYQHVGTLIFCVDDIKSCVCKGEVDDDGGGFLGHRQISDHVKIFGVDTGIYKRSVSLGCEGRLPVSDAEKEVDCTIMTRYDRAYEDEISTAPSITTQQSSLSNKESLTNSPARDQERSGEVSSQVNSLVEAKSGHRKRNRKNSLFRMHH